MIPGLSLHLHYSPAPASETLECNRRAIHDKGLPGGGLRVQVGA